MYNVLDVSIFIINYSNSKERCMDNLKLQKMLYMVQAYYLITDGVPCFDTDIEAWDFGVVVPKVFNQFRIFGTSAIPEIKRVYDMNTKTFIPYSDQMIKPEDKVRIMTVTNHFRNYDATAMKELTCNQKPWMDAYASGRGTVISPEAIKDYFCSSAEINPSKERRNRE